MLPIEEISQNLNIDHLIEALTCGICLNIMDSPKHFDCLHSFCSDCIIKMLSFRGYGDVTIGKYICCPICSKITLIDEDSPHEFLAKIPKNYHLEMICELVRNTMNNKQNYAHVFSPHDPSNDTTTVDNIPNDERFKYCKLHKKNLLKYFCKTCDDLLCRVCEILDHREHTIVDIIDVYKEQEKLLIDLVESNKNNQILLKNAIKEVDSTITNLTQCERDILNSIDESINARIDTIKHMGNELKVKLYKCVRLKSKKLDVQKDQLEMELGKMVFMDTFAKTTLQNDDTVKTLTLKYHLKKICNEFQKLRLEPEEDDSIIFKQNYQSLGEDNLIGGIEVFSTYAELSFASGDGIKSAIVNEPQLFKVITMDRFGNNVAVNKNLHVNIKSPNNLLHCTNVTIKDHHDGTYLVNYTPKFLGKHTIEITIGDVAINGSPFIVNASSKRDYTLEKSILSQKIGVYGTKSKEFKSPLGITSNDKQEIYICDSYNHRIQILGKRGEHLSTFGSHGQKIGLFSCPSGIHMNNTGSLIIVSELTNNRLQLFTRECVPSTIEKETFVLKPKACYGKEGDMPGHFRSPMGVCLSHSNERFYICDRDNSRIQHITIEGHYINSFTTDSEKTFQPVYVCCEPYSNRIFSTDAKNNIIQIFDTRIGSKSISTISNLLNSQCDTLLSPKGIDFDLSGNLVVSDSGNGRVLVLKTDGTVVTEFPPTKSNSYTFLKSPEDVTILPCGKIVTTDILNHQIIIF